MDEKHVTGKRPSGQAPWRDALQKLLIRLLARLEGVRPKHPRWALSRLSVRPEHGTESKVRVGKTGGNLQPVGWPGWREEVAGEYIRPKV